MPKHVPAKDVALAMQRWGIRHILEDGYDDPRIDPYDSGFQPVGVVLHHTAGVNSRAYIRRGSFPPVRNSQFLVGRDGMVYVMAGAGCYHAGRGGPMKVGGFRIPKDAGNRYLYGIEIESMGRSASVKDRPKDRNGMTPAQVKATALLTHALLDIINETPYRSVIRHRDWAPRRKPDVLQPLKWWRQVIKAVRPNTWDRILPPTVRANYTGEDNRRLQARLYDLGFRSRPAAPALIARWPGRAMRKAQKAWGLPHTGTMDAKTYRLLFGGVAVR